MSKLNDPPFQGCKGGSAVGYTCRGPSFESQYIHGIRQSALTLVPRDLKPFLASKGAVHTWAIGIRIGKRPIYIINNPGTERGEICWIPGGFFSVQASQMVSSRFSERP